jgi:dipeptidyl aminopeptidase/acylaminoacyl peptidase
MLVSAGYGVLYPNYRGGSGYGEDYASQARGAMGTNDYGDVTALLNHRVKKGLVDAEKVVVGGYSQGGFLS